MTKIKSPYDSITYENPLSLRVDSNYLSIMSIAPCGRDAVLAGRKGLLVIDLDDPFAPPRWMYHETSWEVADVQWSPHRSKPAWVVSTSNQKALVWNLARSSNDAVEYVLHSHTRAITDIHFHPQHPEMLATCSVDSFVLAWDLRTPKEPVQQWSDWRAGASQVKWNYKDPNIVASSHDNNILIWDVRKGAIPMKSLEAHDAKINCLDWSRDNKYELISSSNDMSVKFWSFDKEYERPVYTIRTDFPVSKTRHLPFGDHVCGVMPLRGGNNAVYLVNYKDKVGETGLEPSYTFKGHTGTVRDFVWRSRHTSNTTVDNSDYQMVTWGSDKDLRLWPLSNEVYEKIQFKRNQPLPAGTSLPEFEYKTYRHEPLVASENKLIIRHKKRAAYMGTGGEGARTNSEFNHLNWISGIKFGKSAFPQINEDPNSANFGNNSNQPLNLGEEFSNVGNKFPKLRFERISVSTGVLVISLNGPWSSENKDDLIFIRAEFNFPKGYPAPNAVPKFKLEDIDELKVDKRQEIVKKIQEVMTKFCQHRRFCLEPCLRVLLGEKVDLDMELDESLDSYSLDNDDENLISTTPDYSDIDNMTGDEEGEEEDDDDDGDDEDDDDGNGGGDAQNEGQETIKRNNETIAEVIQNNKKKAPFDSTPVSKGCGAIWTPSGHLVCFFISKENEMEQQTIRFGQQGFSLVKTLKRKHVSNGLQLNNQNYIDVAMSPSDDESSDDSLSNDFDILQYDRLYRARVPDLLKTMNPDTRQFSSNARSNHLSAPTEKSLLTNNSKTQFNKNVVKIYDFRHLIPIKMELAYEYRVLGDCPHILAEHNSQVAHRYGYTTIANCWTMLSCILLKDVTIDAENAIGLLTRIGQETDNINLVNNYRFYWGYHPFAAKWLVKSIFEYFRKMNNIQMLAMLSCILFENDDIKDHINIPINSPYNNSKTQVERAKPILRVGGSTNSSIKHGTIGRGADRVNSRIQVFHNQSSVSFDRKQSASVYKYNPDVSQGRMPSISTLSSYECDSHSFKSSSPAGDIAFGIGGFPSHNRRGIKRQNSSIIEFGVLPDNSSTNMNSSLSGNVGNYGNVFIPPKMTRTVSMASMNAFNIQFNRAVNETKLPYNSRDRMHDDMPAVKIQMKNVKELDLYENEYCVNIEAFVNGDELRAYRSEYAGILFCWGLPANRLKVLKFNYNSNSIEKYKEKESDFMEHHGQVGWYDDCMILDGDLPQEKWQKTHEKNRCSYCQLTVARRLSVCSACNHIMHDNCAAQWWEEEGMDQCPSGCGCPCMSKHGGM
jgi:WD40 repeat protein